MLKVGDKRKFSFCQEPFEIIEIIENPNVHLFWKWTALVCPHCQKKIERAKEHIFKRIELLAPYSKKDQAFIFIKPYLIALGFDSEGKTMLFPKHKLEEVLSESKMQRGEKNEY